MNNQSAKLYLQTSATEDELHFNDIHALLQAITAMDAEEIEVYIAPGIYWLDDPDSEAVIEPQEQEELPYGACVRFRHLTLTGLGEKPEDVVIAGSRGNAHGAKGNYTMLHFIGERLRVCNLTIGNYCNADLEYPLAPEKNRKKRTTVITQSQVAIMDGAVMHAKNCRFVSRLNLVPICGAQESSYEDCYFECGDDSLNGDAVHKNCIFMLYSDKPIYAAGAKGARFYDCSFYCRSDKGSARTRQYLTKQGGYVALKNCDFYSEVPLCIEWTPFPSCYVSCEQENVHLNGIQAEIKAPSVGMRSKLESEVMTDMLVKRYMSGDTAGIAFDFTCEAVDNPAFTEQNVPIGKLYMNYYRPADADSFNRWDGFETDHVWIRTVYEATDERGELPGMIPGVQGARFVYEDERLAEKAFRLEVELNPAKTEGQGFGSAGQYLDIGLDMDAEAMSGYALRIQRVSDASDAAAFCLLQYKNGKTTVISDVQLADCFVTSCFVEMEIKGTWLFAHVKTTAPQPEYKQKIYPHEVSLQSQITPEHHKGVVLLSTSTTGAGGWQNTTMLQKLKINFSI